MDESEWRKPGWLWAWELFLRRFWRPRGNAVLEWDLDERLLRVRARVMAEVARDVGAGVGAGAVAGDRTETHGSVSAGDLFESPPEART